MRRVVAVAVLPLPLPSERLPQAQTVLRHSADKADHQVGFEPATRAVGRVSETPVSVGNRFANAVSRFAKPVCACGGRGASLPLPLPLSLPLPSPLLPCRSHRAPLPLRGGSTVALRQHKKKDGSVLDLTPPSVPQVTSAYRVGMGVTLFTFLLCRCFRFLKYALSCPFLTDVVNIFCKLSKCLCHFGS